MPELTLAQLLAFINLVEFDKKLLDLEIDKSRIIQEIQTINLQLENLEKTLRSYQDEVSKIQKSVNSLDLETKAFDSQLKQKISKLDRTSAPKEYFSLQDEIEHSKGQRLVLDNQLLALWNELEKAQAKLEIFKADNLSQKNILSKEHEHLKHRLEFTEKTIAQFSPMRFELEKKIEPELLEQYNSLKTQVKRPVVRAVNNICSACSFTLSMVEIGKLNANQLATCKECFRLLYLPEILGLNKKTEDYNKSDEQK